MPNTHDKTHEPIRLQSWQEVIDKPFPELGPVTETTIANFLKYRLRIRGAVRLFSGRILTDERREERRRLADEFISKFRPSSK